jgi:drug/metabolite transporter (DMT)-like permease
MDHDLISERSSNMDTEQLLNKRKNEKYAYILAIITQFLWALNGVQMKTFRTYFPEIYSDNTVLFWRMFLVTIFGYCICKYKNVHIQSHSELKHLKWFLCRNGTAYIFIICWIKMYSYFRVSTISVIGGVTPLIIIILSVFLLSEKFYMRYLIGVFLCIIGSSIIIFNDRKPQSKAQILNDNIFAGILFGIGNISLVSLSVVAQKALTKEGMDVDLQNYYFGLYNCVPAFIFSILLREFTLSSLKYILYVSSNGLIFYSANYLNTLSFKYIAVSKLQPISYLCIVFTFILCAILLGEPVFFSDIVGAAIIISFQYYHFINPPGRTIPITEKESNINNENNK